MSTARLTTAETARRLGVKPETVYAYVSRGLLRSERNAHGRGSLFDRAAVDALAAGRRGAQPSFAISTGVTLIDRGRLHYRGHDACELARSESYESVANLLWTSELRPAALTTTADLVALGSAVTVPLPPSARLTDRLRLIVAAAAAADPLRFDTSPAAVVDCGRMALATMVESLPMRSARRTRAVSLADRLWQRLAPATPTPAGVRALNAALVLLADHDLAASTMAARVAASTRAHPYAVIGAGLAALDGPLHGAASALAYRLLAEAVAAGDPVRVVSEWLRLNRSVPGFGHRLYPHGDPRAAALMQLLADVPDPSGLRPSVDEVAVAMMRRSGTPPNIDFAIASLALIAGMGADAGEAIFAIARTAGWLTHALEEYGDRPMRFRPLGRYDGPPPPTGRLDTGT